MMRTGRGSGIRRHFRYLCVIGAAVTGAACTTGGGGTASDTPPPPAGLTATAVSANQIDLDWDGDSAAGYRIAYAAGTAAPGDCHSGAVIYETDVIGHAHTVTQLRAATTYSFAVCAVGAADYVSAASPPATATTEEGPPDPTSPLATVRSSSEIDLSWTGGGGATAGYQITYAAGAPPADCFSGTAIAGAAISGTSHAVTGLSGGTHYGFRICAVDAGSITSVSNGTTAAAATYSLTRSSVALGAAQIPIGGTDSVTLTLRDAAGNVLPLPSLNAAFSLGAGTSTGSFGAVTDHGDGTYSATFTATTRSGNATQVRATINGEALSGTAPTLQVDPGPLDPAQTTIGSNPASPATVLEGQDVRITVTARDAYGNREIDGGAAVALSHDLAPGMSTGTLGPVADLNNGLYMATFAATGAGSATTISGTVNGVSIGGGAAPTITVNPCSVSQVTWVQAPNGTRTAGQSFTAGTVELQDANQNICGVTPVAFTVEPATNDTGGSLSGPGSVAPAGGYADLSAFNIHKAGTYHILATANGAQSPPSAAVTVTAGAAAQLAFTHVPPTWVAGAANSVQAALEDTYGNVAVGTNGGSVTLTLQDNPAGGTLAGITTVDVAANVATFNGLSLDAPGSGYTLSAAYRSYHPVSGAFDVADGTGTGLNLQVPIELTDMALGNSGAAPDVARATETSFDPADYDGTVNVYFEIVATNGGAAAGAVALDQGCGAAAVTGSTLTVPPGTTTPTRYRSGALTLAAAHYCVDVAGLPPTANVLVVDSARLIVDQAGAHTTKVYVPLLSDSAIDTAIDRVTKNVGSYTQLNANRYAIWNKDTTHLADIAANGFVFEVLAQGSSAGNASVAFVDRANEAVIAATYTGLGGGVNFKSVPFDSVSAPLFAEGDDYEVRMRGGSSGGSLYKAGLWIKLEDLTKYATYWRTNRLLAGVTAATLDARSRQLLATDRFSGPALDLACTGTMTAPGDLALDLVSVAADTGTAAQQPISSSALTIASATKALVTATGLSGYTSGRNILTGVTGTTGSLDAVQCLTVIHN